MAYYDIQGGGIESHDSPYGKIFSDRSYSKMEEKADKLSKESAGLTAGANAAAKVAQQFGPWGWLVAGAIETGNLIGNSIISAKMKPLFNKMRLAKINNDKLQGTVIDGSGKHELIPSDKIQAPTFDPDAAWKAGLTSFATAGYYDGSDFDKSKNGGDVGGGIGKAIGGVAQGIQKLGGTLGGGIAGGNIGGDSIPVTSGSGDMGVKGIGGDAFNFDMTGLGQSGLGEVGPDGQMLFKNGGAVEVKGAKKDGENQDTIALIDTVTGEDTNIRVSPKEKIIVSEKTVGSLKNAIENEDKNLAFKLIKGQMKEKPEVKDGKEHFAEGGNTGATGATGNYEKPKDNNSSGPTIRYGMSEGEKVDPNDISQMQRRIALWEKMRDENLRNPLGIKKLVDDANATIKKIMSEYNIGIDSNQINSTVSPTTTKSASKKTGGNSGSGKTKPGLPFTAKDAVDRLPEEEILDNKRKQIEAENAISGDAGAIAKQGDGIDIIRPTVGPAAITKGNQFDWRNALGYGADGIRLGLGLAGANQQVPTWSPTYNWNEFMRGQKDRANMGLSPEEKALYNDQAASQYLTDVENIKNYSGGSGGVVLGNLGRANSDRLRSALRLALLDRNARSENISNYGRWLSADEQYRKGLFDDQVRNPALLTRQTGAQLANDAINNIQERSINDEYYGTGSLYDRYLQAKIAREEEETRQLQQSKNTAKAEAEKKITTS